MALTQIEQGMLKDGILTADTAGRLKVADGFVNAAKLASGAARSNFGAGAVLQVVSTTKTDTTAFAGTTTWFNVSGVSATITPSSTSSKILVWCVVMFSGENSYNAVNFAVARNGTRTPVGNAVGARTSSFIGSDDWYGATSNAGQAILMYLDSPATTSSVTYQLQGGNFRDSETIYINRSAADSDNSQTTRGVSTITLMEIAG